MHIIEPFCLIVFLPLSLFSQSDTIPPSVSFISPRNNSYIACHIAPIIASVTDPSGIVRESIVFVLNGVSYNLTNPNLQLIDTILFYNQLEPYSGCGEYQAVIVGVTDSAGNSIAPPYPGMRFFTDLLPPRIIGFYPSFGETISTTRPTLYFIIRDDCSGLDSGSVELELMGRRFNIYDPAVSWRGDTIRFNTALAGLELPQLEHLQFCISANDRTSDCGPNQLDTCISFFVRGEEISSVKLRLWYFNSRYFPEITGFVEVKDTIRNVHIEGLNATNFIVREFGEPQYPLRVVPRGTFRKVDVIVVFDVTGSMGSSIRLLQDQVIVFAESLQAVGLDYRFGLVTFRDNVELPHGRELTDDVLEFQSWIGALEAIGGGDIAENSLDALYEACSMNFRDDAGRVFILITDAPPHTRDDGSGFAHFMPDEIIDTLLRYDVVLFVFGIDVPPWSGTRNIPESTGGAFFPLFADINSVVPILSSGSRYGYYLTYISSNTNPDCDLREVEVFVEVVRGDETFSDIAIGTYRGPCGPQVVLIEPLDGTTTSRPFQHIVYKIFDPDGRIDTLSPVLQVNDTIYTFPSRPMHFEYDSIFRYIPSDSFIHGERVCFRLLSARDTSGYTFEGEDGFHCFIVDREGPTAELVYPDQGSTVQDTITRIIIMIIDSLSGINPSSIDVRVKGVQFRLGVAGFSFSYPFLYIEPRLAGIRFAPAETVNISLVAANDMPTYGRPNRLTDAPREWQFYIASTHTMENQIQSPKFELRALYPVPANLSLKYTIYTGCEKELTTKLFNVYGTLIYEKTSKIIPFTLQELNLPLEMFPSGMYILMLKTNQYLEIKPIVILK